MRGFRDRDYLETVEGLYFTVLGNLHPPGRVVAYLKYAPSPRGRWGKPPRLFDRPIKAYTVRNVKVTLEFLRRRYPRYLYRIESFNVEFSAVPLARIKRHYRPEDKLLDLLASKGRDELQEKAVRLAALLSKESGVDLKSFGVTGSILIGLHNLKFSDVDLVVYGGEEGLAVKEALRALLAKGDKVRRFPKGYVEGWHRSRKDLYPLTLKETLRLFERVWNRGEFSGTAFSIHPVKAEEEKYGEEVYAPVGMVEAEGEVVDSKESIFMPAKYKVSFPPVEFRGEKYEVEEVVSYEGLYSGVVEPGERISVRGKLEEVKNVKGSKAYFRIVVGSPEAGGNDYVKPLG